MDKVLLRNISLEMILVVAIVLLLVFLIKIYLSVVTEKRIAPFSMDNNHVVVTSFTDILISFFVGIIKKTSKLLSKLVSMKNYAKRFDKRLILSEDAYFDSMDYVSLKFYVMILIQILYIISNGIKFINFNPYVFLLVSTFLISDIFFILKKFTSNTEKS